MALSGYLVVGSGLGRCAKTCFAKVHDVLRALVCRHENMLRCRESLTIKYEREPNYRFFESYGYDHRRSEMKEMVDPLSYVNVDRHEDYLTA